MALAVRRFGQRARLVAGGLEHGERALEVPILDLPDQIKNLPDSPA